MDELLYLQDISAARQEIEAAGGRITQILGPHVLVANLPQQVDVSSLKAVSREPVVQLDSEESALATAWKTFREKPPQKQKPRSWDTPGFQGP